MVHVIIIKQIGHGGRVVGWHNSKQQFAGSNPPTAGFFSLKKAHVLVFNCGECGRLPLLTPVRRVCGDRLAS